MTHPITALVAYGALVSAAMWPLTSCAQNGNDSVALATFERLKQTRDTLHSIEYALSFNITYSDGIPQTGECTVRQSRADSARHGLFRIDGTGGDVQGLVVSYDGEKTYFGHSDTNIVIVDTNATPRIEGVPGLREILGIPYSPYADYVDLTVFLLRNKKATATVSVDHDTTYIDVHAEVDTLIMDRRIGISMLSGIIGSMTSIYQSTNKLPLLTLKIILRDVVLNQTMTRGFYHISASPNNTRYLGASEP